MDDKIVAIYSIVSDFLKAMHHHEDPQCQMNDAEVLTTAIVAALFFGANFELARSLLGQSKYIPSMLSKSRFNLQPPLTSHQADAACAVLDTGRIMGIVKCRLDLCN